MSDRKPTVTRRYVSATVYDIEIGEYTVSVSDVDARNVVTDLGRIFGADFMQAVTNQVAAEEAERQRLAEALTDYEQRCLEPTAA